MFSADDASTTRTFGGAGGRTWEAADDAAARKAWPEDAAGDRKALAGAEPATVSEDGVATLPADALDGAATLPDGGATTGAAAAAATPAARAPSGASADRCAATDTDAAAGPAAAGNVV